MANNKKHKKTPTSWQIERIDPNKVPWYGKKLVLEHKERYEFAKRSVKGKIVAELGCGTGYGTYLLTKAGAKKIYAIDVSKEAITYAKRHYYHRNIEYSVADALHVTLPSNSIDCVIAFEVIEHIKKDTHFLKEVFRILKKNGIFILSTPNKDLSLGDNPYHFKEYSFTELQKVLFQFSALQFYGQRKVNKKIFNIYQKILKRISHPLLRLILRFRPWESYTIHPLRNKFDTSYLYFLVVCQKS